MFWGWQIRNLQRVPSGIDIDNLMPAQELFFMLLTGAAAPPEALASYISSFNAREEILKKDFTEDVYKQYPAVAIENLAKIKGVTVSEYVRQAAEQLKKEALKEFDHKKNQGKTGKTDGQPREKPDTIDRNPPMLGQNINRLK